MSHRCNILISVIFRNPIVQIYTFIPFQCAPWVVQYMVSVLQNAGAHRNEYESECYSGITERDALEKKLMLRIPPI